jgi:hypothetical protein
VTKPVYIPPVLEVATNEPKAEPATGATNFAVFFTDDGVSGSNGIGKV